MLSMLCWLDVTYVYRMDGSGDYQQEQNGEGQARGPIIRSASRKPERDYSNYEDSVKLIDCRPFWRRLGVTNVSRYPRELWFVKDVCGVICAIFTWGLVFYAEFVVMYVMLMPSQSAMHSVVNGIIFQFLAFMAIASHARAMLTDPVSSCLICTIVFIQPSQPFKSLEII